MLSTDLEPAMVYERWIRTRLAGNWVDKTAMMESSTARCRSSATLRLFFLCLSPLKHTPFPPSSSPSVFTPSSPKDIFKGHQPSLDWLPAEIDHFTSHLGTSYTPGRHWGLGWSHSRSAKSQTTTSSWRESTGGGNLLHERCNGCIVHGSNDLRLILSLHTWSLIKKCCRKQPFVTILTI